MTEPLALTERTRFRRRPQRGNHDRAVVEAILDEAYVCHVGFVVDDEPIVIPTAFVRVGDAVYLHGSAANHMLGVLASGAPASIAVTLLDAIVLARTAFHHSVNYRSVVMFGRGRAVEAAAEKRRVLAALLDKMVAGRAEACRPPDDTELHATRVIAFPIAEAAAKIRTGPPVVDEGSDAALPYFAGIIPLVTTRGEPVPA